MGTITSACTETPYGASAARASVAAAEQRHTTTSRPSPPSCGQPPTSRRVPLMSNVPAPGLCRIKSSWNHWPPVHNGDTHLVLLGCSALGSAERAAAASRRDRGDGHGRAGACWSFSRCAMLRLCDRCIRRILRGVVSWRGRLSRSPPKRQGVQRWRSHAMRQRKRYWRGVIRRLEASGLGPRQFCKRQRLSEHRLHWWRRRLRRDQGQSRRPSSTRGHGRVRGRGDRGEGSPFLPVGIPFSVGEPIEVVHPRGHVIRVPVIFDATTLGHILAAIDGPAGASGR